MAKLLIPLSALALVGCARHTIPQVTLIPQTYYVLLEETPRRELGN